MQKSKRILALVCFTVLSEACQMLTPTQPPTLSEKDQYRMLREDALRITPDMLGMKPDLNSNTPYGVVMDDGLDRETTTTVAGYASGDAYLLTNSGRSNVDGIKYPNVNSAAQKFVSTAADFVENLKPVTDYSLPSVNHVKFYVLTPTEIYASEEFNKNDLIAKSNPFYSLYYAEQDVVTAFRLSSSP